MAKKQRGTGPNFYRLMVRFSDGSQTAFGPVTANLAERVRSDLTPLANPTRGPARVQYSVARPGRVRLEVLDVSGRIAATLSDRVQTPGHYVAIWDGAGRGGRSSPGLYFVRLSAADGVTTRKLALIE